MMSDGLSERFNLAGEMLGSRRICQRLFTVRDRDPEAIVQALTALGEEWAEGREQDDDLTLMVIKMNR